jgi:hypothetical protein
MAAKKKVIRIIKDINDPKVKDKLLKLFIERDKLMKQKEKEQIEMHNKYLPKYLSTKILNAVGFIEYTLQKGKLNMPDMIKFLQTEKKFSQREIGWVMLLLSLETVEEILGTPEIGGKIQEAIIENRKKTLH